MLLDPTLPEKQRARRRLVGAIALVVAAVVILPMVLDSHPKPVTDDISIDIPSRPVSRARAQNPEDTQAGVAPDNPAAPENAAGASNLVPAVPPAVAAAGAPGRSGSSMAPQAGAQQGDTTAAQRSTSGTSGKTQQQATTASTNNATAPATKPAAKGTSTGTSTAATAANTTQSPSAAASSRSSTTSSASPSAQSTTAAAQTDSATPPGSRFAVQLGAFPDDASARAWESKLKAAGVPAYTEKRKQADGSVRTLLRAGPFADRAAASAAIAKVREAGLTSGANNGSAQ
jgi:DedD protein